MLMATLIMTTVFAFHAPVANAMEISTLDVVNGLEYEIRGSNADYGAGAYVFDYVGESPSVIVPEILGGQPVVYVKLVNKYIITSLDVSDAISLKYLNCGYCNIIDLDVSNNEELVHFECVANKLEELNVTNNPNIKYLNCYSNKLTSLDVSNLTTLISLYCQNNLLTELDVSNTPALKQLFCDNNNLVSIDLSDSGILVNEFIDFDCRYNYLPDTPERDALIAKFGINNILPQHGITNLVTGITVSAGAASVSEYNGTLQFSAIIAPSDALIKTVTWSISSGGDLATISKDGLLVAKANGTVTVRATAKDGSKIYGEKVITINIPTWTATFDAVGGTAVAAKDVIRGHEIGTLPASTQTGYAFDGWWTAASGGTQISATTVLTANSTYYAHWLANGYTATFLANGGETVSPATIVAVYDTALGALPTVARTGYTFGGWFTEASGGTEISATTKITQDITYYAHWTVNVYTVTFDVNGGLLPGNIPQNISATYDSTYGTLPTPSRKGYAFVGWFTAKTGGTKITPSTVVKFTENQTHYAQWVAKTYVVTYDANGGNIAGKAKLSKALKYHAKYVLPATPTKKGYAFTGWYTNKKGGKLITASSIVKILEKQILYARWAKGYVVKFNSKGGKAVASKAVAKNKKVGALTSTTRAGYKFLGWYTKANGGKKISKGTKVTKNVTYFAHWKKK
jgi:uncharacterized repeat protein (TIGR02543 family)